MEFTSTYTYFGRNHAHDFKSLSNIPYLQVTKTKLYFRETIYAINQIV